MVGTLLGGADYPPAGSGPRGVSTWLVLHLHLLGNALGGSAAGVILGMSGAALPDLSAASATIVIGASALVLAGRDLRFYAIPLPERQRQVPHGWRFLSPRVSAFLYGLALGPGVFVRIPNSAFYLLPMSALLFGPSVGAVVFVFYGIGRALPLYWLHASSSGNSTEVKRLNLDLIPFAPVARVGGGLALTVFGTAAVSYHWIAASYP